MTYRIIAAVAVAATMLTGCVFKGLHTNSFAGVEESPHTTAEAATDIEAIEAEQVRLSNALVSAQISASNLAELTQRALEATQQELVRERELREHADTQIARLQDQQRQLGQLNRDLRGERDLLLAQTGNLARRLAITEPALVNRNQSLTDAHARLAALQQEKGTATAALHDNLNKAEVLETALAAQEARIAALEKEKQQLLTGKADAHARLAALRQEKDTAAAALRDSLNKAETLETELAAKEARVAGLEKEKQQLLTGKATAQDDIARLQQRAGELDTEAARIRQERDDLAAQVRSQQEATDAAEQALARLRQREGQLQADLQQQAQLLQAAQIEKSRLEQARAAKDADITILTQAQASLYDALEAQDARGTRLEQARAAKHAEVRRLAQAHADLKKSLEAEIAKGTIKIQQLRDRLTITMVDRILFDSGEAQVTPEGRDVLTRVSKVLKSVTDKQIRIEGHTDNVPIGPKLVDRFPTNWELSTARATTVVRYLIDTGDVDEARLSAVGYADNRPVEPNDTEEGQARNRRIEIVLYPKNLTEIADQVGL